MKTQKLRIRVKNFGVINVSVANDGHSVSINVTEDHKGYIGSSAIQSSLFTNDIFNALVAKIIKDY